MGGSRGSIMDEGPCPRPPRLERLHRKGEHRCTTEGAVSVEIPTLSSAASLSGCSLERLRSGQSAPSASRSRGGVLAASCSTWNGSYLIRVCWESASQTSSRTPTTSVRNWQSSGRARPGCYSSSAHLPVLPSTHAARARTLALRSRRTDDTDVPGETPAVQRDCELTPPSAWPTSPRRSPPPCRTATV
jgi:hypothetical protein